MKSEKIKKMIPEGKNNNNQTLSKLISVSIFQNYKKKPNMAIII